MARGTGSGRVDVAVVGGGPAGLTAAIYLGRLHRGCVVLDAGHSRARWIPESNNCPGFPGGISGDALLARLREQAAQFGARLERTTVTALQRDGGGFRLEDGQGRTWQARAVVLATGLADRLPPMEDVEAAIACGALRLCPVCDAYEVTGRRIGVHGPWAAITAHARFLRGYTADLALLPTDHAGRPMTCRTWRCCRPAAAWSSTGCTAPGWWTGGATPSTRSIRSWAATPARRWPARPGWC